MGVNIHLSSNTLLEQGGGSGRLMDISAHPQRLDLGHFACADGAGLFFCCLEWDHQDSSGKRLDNCTLGWGTEGDICFDICSCGVAGRSTGSQGLVRLFGAGRGVFGQKDMLAG